MKKNYEAPNLEIITYSLHEALAASCDDLIYNNHNKDTCDPVQFQEFSFLEDTCTEPPVLSGYCYYASASYLRPFNS